MATPKFVSECIAELRLTDGGVWEKLLFAHDLVALENEIESAIVEYEKIEFWGDKMPALFGAVIKVYQKINFGERYLFRNKIVELWVQRLKFCQDMAETGDSKFGEREEYQKLKEHIRNLMFYVVTHFEAPAEPVYEESSALL